MKDLLTLEGCWVGDAKMVADGQTFMFKYYADCKQAAGGYGLTMYEWLAP